MSNIVANPECNNARNYTQYCFIIISQGALEIDGELLCFVGTLIYFFWLCITSGIPSPVCHQPNTGRAEWNTDGTGIYTYKVIALL